jgi:hypothetical protein
VGTLRRECLDHLLILGERHLREVLGEYARHYSGITTAIGHTQTLRQLPPLHGPGREIDITARIERKRAVETDGKGQAMSKAGPSLLRATFFRAADTARRQDPQLARIYYLQMTERGATHIKACCVVAGHLAERAWAVLNRGTPYVICDNHSNPVTPAEAKKIIAERWTVPEEVRKRRRSRKIAGKAPQPALTRPGTRGDPPRPRSSRSRTTAVNPAT